MVTISATSSIALPSLLPIKIPRETHKIHDIFLLLSFIIHEDNYQPELSICTTCCTLKPRRILSGRVQIHFKVHVLPREQSQIVNIPSFH